MLDRVGLVGLAGLANHLCQGGQLAQLWCGRGFLGPLSGLERPGALEHREHLIKLVIQGHRKGQAGPGCLHLLLGLGGLAYRGLQDNLRSQHHLYR